MRSWERQKGEKDREWDVFQVFLKQEKRNKREVARLTGFSEGRLYSISRLWYWNDRATAYDNWLQRAEDNVLYEGREQLAREHLGVIRKARDVADEALTELLKSIRRVNDSVELAPRDALAFLEKAVTLERLVTGEATERTETFDLTKLSGDEAEKMLELLEKLK